MAGDVRSTMRPALGLLVAPLALVALVACGEDRVEDPAGGAGTTVPADLRPTIPTVPTTVPPNTVPAGDGPRVDDIEVATGADDVVISVGYEGGFMPMGFTFAQVPNMVVTGDGRVITPGVVPAIYPGPFRMPLLERTISDAGVQRLLALADEHGLLADVEYAHNDMVADAPNTVVTIAADGATYVHRAYALDMEGTGEDDEARAALSEFVVAVGDIAAAAGDDELGPEEPYAADNVLIQALAVDPQPAASDPLPTVVEWPADAPVRLADAGECVAIQVAEAETLFADADQATYFLDGDQHYQIFAVDQIPGRTC